MISAYSWELVGKSNSEYRYLRYATRIGVSEAVYAAHLANGDKWCTGHKTWHPLVVFGVDQERHDGRTASCRAHGADITRARKARRRS